MYALWLMPEPSAHERLTSLISRLSDDYQTPRFEPHVTLLSGITHARKEAIAGMKQLGKANAAPRVKLNGIEYLDMFYRCLFFRTDEKKVLFDLRDQAKLIFGETQIEPFVPHVSFLYGDIPKFTKEHIVSELGDLFYIEFTLPTLRLVKTELTPDYWEIIEEVPFSGR